jgi:hypothetical protein
MKKLIVIATIAILSFTTTAIAADEIITSKIYRIDKKTDKDGKEYIRAVVKEPRTLNGIRYEASVLLMAFDTQDQLADVSVGDELKMVVSSTTYNGRKNYTLIQVIE